jgi:crossover junction endodeoxyribonuclease RusA
VVEFFVAGIPIQQGSSRAFVVKGRAVITSDTRRGLKDWRSDIAFEARRHFTTLWQGPVAIDVTFVMPRPKSLAKKYERPWQTTRPDADKLLRALFDSLKGVAYLDDAQVAMVTLCKVTAAVGEQSGAQITMREMT